MPVIWSSSPSHQFQESDTYDLSIKRDEFLYMASEHQTKAFEIVKGYVKLSLYSNDGRETIVSILKPGDMLGNFDPSQSYAFENAQALSKTELKVYESLILKRAIRHNPSFVMKLLADRQRRIYQLQRQISSFAFLDVAERIQYFLLFLGKEYGKIQDGTAFLDNFLTHHDIS